MARISPDNDFLGQVEEIIDDSLTEYQEFLKQNNDIDDIHGKTQMSGLVLRQTGHPTKARVYEYSYMPRT